ncbi:glycosyltransferase [Pontiellaceae bacterium B12219]|nr:glycosyltransferase [Pontiellaceae bacterium B12219]
MDEPVLFVGALNLGRPATAGAMAKNQHLFRFFKERFKSIRVIDAIDLRKRPLLSGRILIEIFRSDRTRPIIFSSSAKSTCLLVRMLMFLNVKRNVYFWVLGGDLAESVKRGDCAVRQLAYFNRVLVEGNSMRVALESEGLTNVHVVPNFREVGALPETPKHSNKKRFVFLSRITREKGVDLIFKSVRQLNVTLSSDRFSVDLYGVIDPSYEEEFRTQLSDFDNVAYRRFLDLGDCSNYDILAGYDTMLFPTFFSGEGFPGVLIDAFIAGLPVIASDWNLNGDVIEDGVTGIIIPARDALALKDAMLQVIRGDLDLNVMSQRCQQQAQNYAIENVLNDDLLEELGLLPESVM